MILYLLIRALLGLISAALTAAAIWLLIRLIRTGPARTLDDLRDLGPVADGIRFSAPWLTKTGALPAGVLGLIAAPYLGPILGGYLWRPLAGVWIVLASCSAELGALLVGIAAGILGYFLRVP